MKTLFIILCFFYLNGQLRGQETDFECPDEFEGYYPHYLSCDKYWKCRGGTSELKTCGNGLAFNDLDETFTTENCDYIYNVDCKNRTQVEDPISTTNCLRLYGTFHDPEDCSIFYNCRNGLADRFSCAPGLAFDRNDRVCKWADQVKECKSSSESENEIFKCPKSSGTGLYSKHGHPEDCRLYYVCIGGLAREYGCPLGTVFDIGSDDFDGKCTDPKEVSECSNYYGDLNFDKQELVRAGVDPEAVGAVVTSGRSRISRPSFNPSTTTRTTTTTAFASFLEVEERIIEAPLENPLRTRLSSNTRNKFQGTNQGKPSRLTPSSSTLSSSTENVVNEERKPAKIKAGDDYYYYYYYYDDDDENSNVTSTHSSTS